jgi:AraC family transcriptional regulator, regulatory protein of adaptative response / methylated-DNA-[protein]-cysteine methyltransferase
MTAPTQETYPTDTPHCADEERWAAVLRRDPAFDGTFVYAVRTTGIYCRPTCPARRPLRSHVEFHPTTTAAVQAGFRPCHRCRPDAPSPIAQRTALIARLCRRIESAATPPSLQALADEIGMSPSHLHRLFKSIVGVTPKAYASAHRTKQLRSSLGAAPSVTAAIHDTGYGSHSAFYAEAPRSLGMAASSYRRGGRDETIRLPWATVGWVACWLRQPSRASAPF